MNIQVQMETTEIFQNVRPGHFNQIVTDQVYLLTGIIILNETCALSIYLWV